MTVRGVRVSTEPGVQTGRINTSRLGRIAAGVSLAAVAACAPRPPAPTGLPSGTAPAPRVGPAPIVREWSVSAPTTITRFALSSTAIIHASADTVVRTDSVATSTGVRVTPRGAAYDIALDSHVVRVTGAPPLRIGNGPRAIARLSQASGWEFVGANLDPCAGPTRAAFEATRDLWVQWPALVRATTRWTDTTVIELCRDGIPLRAILVRQFSIAQPPASDEAPLIVHRRSTLTLTGRGQLRGDSTTVTGEGTSDALLYVGPSVGWLDSATSTSMLRLSVRGTQRTQAVEQRTTTQIHRAPDLP